MNINDKLDTMQDKINFWEGRVKFFYAENERFRRARDAQKADAAESKRLGALATLDALYELQAEGE